MKEVTVTTKEAPNVLTGEVPDPVTEKFPLSLPRWQIRGLSGEFDCIFSGIPHTRCTRVYQQCEKAQKTPLIVKRVWGRRPKDLVDGTPNEIKILKKIHGGGSIPGLVRGCLMESLDRIVINPYEWLPEPKAPLRMNVDILYLDTGLPLAKSATLYEFLEACYDIVEGLLSFPILVIVKITHTLCWILTALRYLAEIGIVHRDISPANLFVQVRSVFDFGDVGGHAIPGYLREFSPNFKVIHEVLGKESKQYVKCL